MSELELEELFGALPSRRVALPRIVTARLGLVAPFSEAEAFAAAVAWLRSRPRRALCAEARDEVVYQAYLGPFLGFGGELGTLVSLTCFLPFIVEDLQATAILLLPLLKRGRTRHKGLAGSPFAVADHECLEPAMSGFPPGVDASAAWRAIVAAARSVGVRMGMVVPLATVAMDSPCIARDPSLVHWWRAEPTEVLTGDRVASKSVFATSAVPASSATARFCEAPAPEDVCTRALGDDVFFVARDGEGRTISVANAYPDPVIGESSTYAWRDVAAVRFYDAAAPRAYAAHRHDGDVGPVPAGADALLRYALRQRLESGETVMLADVSPALPASVLRNSLPSYPQMLGIAEQLWDFSAPPPFEFVLGPFVPCVAAHCAAPATITESLAYHLRLLGATRDPRRFMAGVANHDTVPCSSRWARSLLTVFCLLPHGVPFLYSGTEFANESLTNAEFGTFPDERPHPTEAELLLFSPRPVPVSERALETFVDFWSDLLALRRFVTRRGVPSDVTDVRADGFVVSCRVGDMRFVVNCGNEPAALDLVRVDRTLITPCAIETADSVPPHGVVLSLPATEDHAALAGSLRYFRAVSAKCR